MRKSVWLSFCPRGDKTQDNGPKKSVFSGKDTRRTAGKVIQVSTCFHCSYVTLSESWLLFISIFSGILGELILTQHFIRLKSLSTGRSHLSPIINV